MLLLAKAALGIGGTLALAGVYVFHEGVIRVDVDELRGGGSHVHVFVPATVVPIALRVAPRHHLEEAAAKASPYLPVLREVAKELKKYPNAELVDVQNGSQHVHVGVHEGRIYVDAVDENETIHVRVPVETVSDVADRLESLAPGV
jgi:hypothetical protein